MIDKWITLFIGSSSRVNPRGTPGTHTYVRISLRIKTDDVVLEILYNVIMITIMIMVLIIHLAG